jgi:predicted nuclease of restriction endonuclease-like (RecB) superfamily
LPWTQNIELLAKLKDPEDRLWYAEATLEHGRSGPVLAAQIQTRLRDRQGQAVTNFGNVLPPAASDLAQQILKDPYQFEFFPSRRTPRSVMNLQLKQEACKCPSID